MDQLRPIFWGQGMFLQPQHFQQQDRYHEARLRRYLHSLYPFCWGVKSLRINELGLQNFRFEIEQCELLTWEGTIVGFQSQTSPSNTHVVTHSFEGIRERHSPCATFPLPWPYTPRPYSKGC
jgi:predicted component of type VI protein secretion system